MVKKIINVPIYNWKVIVYICESPQDHSELKRELKRNSPDIEQNAIMLQELEQEKYNGGWTLTYAGFHKCIIVIYPHVHKCKLYNTLFHEKRHVEDNILSTHSIDDSESAAMLAGYLAEKLSDIIEKADTLLHGNKN